jgi:predicted amidohydrolase
VKIVVSAVQMHSELLQQAVNLDVADEFLSESHRSGAALSVLPEMFNTGYGLVPDFGPFSEGADGPTLRHLSRRSREWGMGIAAGFVERDGRHLYDSLALCLPSGSIDIYRKRQLVFWEAFRFRAGRTPLIVRTPWGRLGLAVCADMMDHRVWDGYRGRGASPVSALVFGFWLASPRATRGQGHHPEFCWLSRGSDLITSVQT